MTGPDAQTAAPGLPRLTYRPAEVAAALGISERSVTRLIAEGALSAVKLGKRSIGIRREDLYAFIERGRST